jgi:hypothetical protein
VRTCRNGCSACRRQGWFVILGGGRRIFRGRGRKIHARNGGKFHRAHDKEEDPAVRLAKRCTRHDTVVWRYKIGIFLLFFVFCRLSLVVVFVCFFLWIIPEHPRNGFSQFETIFFVDLSYYSLNKFGLNRAKWRN